MRLGSRGLARPAIVDHLNKMVHFVPLPKLPSAKEMARTILLHIFRPHGRIWFLTRVPSSHPSSGGSSAPSSEPQTACPPDSTPNSMDRLNKEMETMLCCMVSRNPSSWSQQLLWVGTPTTAAAAELGSRPGLPSSAQLSSTQPRPTDTVPGHPPPDRPEGMALHLGPSPGGI